MSDSFYTLADLTKINDNNLADIDVSDLFNKAPLLAQVAATVASNGTVHKYVKETTAPTVGFREVNTGRENSKSGDTLVTVTLKYLDASVSIDKAICDGYKGGPSAILAREAVRHLRQGFFEAESQFLNGTGNEADGFNGLADSLNATSLDFVIDAGGSAAGGSGDTLLTSIYLVRSTGDLSDVAVVTGNDGMIDMSEAFLTTIDDDDNGGRFTAWHMPIASWLGMQVGSAKSVARIANIDNGSNKVTDDLIYSAIKEFDSAMQPTHIVMNRRSAEQLRASRTATNATGAPAPYATEVNGVPVVVVDSLNNNESEVS